MAVVMYEDFGIRYNPDRIAISGNLDPNDRFFADSRDIFLHGLVGNRRMGTCSSMSVLYAAIGRRLGYPLKLATTKAHLFLRWEDDK
jgi:regulator of sirC expression with transglutaminase-like and TPR domain